MMSEDWKKSSYSNGSGGACVEARATVRGADVRDTQNRDLGYLGFEVREWSALLGALASK